MNYATSGRSKTELHHQIDTNRDFYPCPFGCGIYGLTPEMGDWLQVVSDKDQFGTTKLPRSSIAGSLPVPAPNLSVSGTGGVSFLRRILALQVPKKIKMFTQENPLHFHTSLWRTLGIDLHLSARVHMGFLHNGPEKLVSC